MRVLIDARPAVSEGMTGIGYYTKHMIELLPEVDADTTYVAWYLNFRALLRPFRRRRFFDHVRSPNLDERSTPFPAQWFERLSERYEKPRTEWFERFDVLFAPNFVPPPTRTRRLVLTVHDLAFKRFPESTPLATRRWLTRLDRALVQAAQVIAVSEATKRDLVELYPVDPGRVTVVPHGVDRDLFRPAPSDEIEGVRRRFGINGPYLFFVGGIEPRKNLPRLVRGFARIAGEADAVLVVAGASVPWNPEGRAELAQVLAGIPEDLRRRIVFAGYLADRDKVALLSGAEALVFPSLYEGFGLPVLEAMACGTPVLTSNVSALPEVAGDAAILVDPLDEESIADGMKRLLDDRGLRGRLRAAGLARAGGFSWRETARKTAAVLRRA